MNLGSGTLWKLERNRKEVRSITKKAGKMDEGGCLIRRGAGVGSWMGQAAE